MKMHVLAILARWIQKPQKDGMQQKNVVAGKNLPYVLQAIDMGVNRSVWTSGLKPLKYLLPK